MQNTKTSLFAKEASDRAPTNNEVTNKYVITYRHSSFDLEFAIIYKQKLFTVL